MAIYNQKVFGIGMGRTGTTSLADALNLLGIATKHFPSDQITQQELLAGKSLTMLSKYQGLVDGIAPFYRQLSKHYPDGQFILTIRNQSEWLTSVKKFDELRAQNPVQSATNYSDELRYLTYGAYQLDDETLMQGYSHHLQSVKDFFESRPESLLIMDICGGDGWEKLTTFLDIPMPLAPFPHSNNLQAVASWRQLVVDINQKLGDHIGRKSQFILVDENQLDINYPNAHPFIARDGNYWGAPPDDSTAIAELDKAIRGGVEYIAFTEPAFWWLDHYTRFLDYITSRGQCTHESENIIIYRL